MNTSLSKTIAMLLTWSPVRENSWCGKGNEVKQGHRKHTKPQQVSHENEGGKSNSDPINTQTPVDFF